jgi:predicted O-linked N-acetylglucosamine transferase (SPINDLY family)
VAGGEQPQRATLRPTGRSPVLNRAQRRSAAKEHPRQFAEAMRQYQAGRLREAERICQQILGIDPNHIGALHVAGIIAVQVGLDQVAVNLLGRAVALNDRLPDLHEGIAFALQRLGDLDRALTHYQRALSLNPKSLEALYNGGNALFQLRRYEAALALYDRALTLKPDFAEALHNRANAWLELGRNDRALADYDRALAVRPEFPQALANRGAALIGLRRFEEGLASCERALAIDPANPTALANRGSAHFEMRRFAEAARDFDQLLAIDPGYVYAPGKLLYCKLLDCDWRDYDRGIAALSNAVVAGQRAALPFMFFNMVDAAAAQLDCARTYCGDKHPPVRDPVWQGEHYDHPRVRVAYLSADFRQHPMALLMAGVFEAHDRSRFETIAVSYGPDPKDDFRRRLEAAFDRFLDVQAASDRDLALMLREMEVDIAVDLMGYTNNGRPGILAYRPAPVQVNFLGYAGTMAAGHIDYLVADRFLIPEDRRDCYSESIVYLPDTYLPTDGGRKLAAPPPRATAGLPERGFVFCCFNNNYKIVPPVFDIWMRLLAAVDGSVLWLIEDSAHAARNLRAEAEQRGIAADRLVFAPRVGLDDYLARLPLADLFLDTLPYNAHTTAADALWAGLPVVTCAGDSFAARVAGSVLSAVGLPELITPTPRNRRALS